MSTIDRIEGAPAVAGGADLQTSQAEPAPSHPVEPAALDAYLAQIPTEAGRQIVRAMRTMSTAEAASMARQIQAQLGSNPDKFLGLGQEALAAMAAQLQAQVALQAQIALPQQQRSNSKRSSDLKQILMAGFNAGLTEFHFCESGIIELEREEGRKATKSEIRDAKSLQQLMFDARQERVTQFFGAQTQQLLGTMDGISVAARVNFPESAYQSMLSMSPEQVAMNIEVLVGALANMERADAVNRQAKGRGTVASVATQGATLADAAGPPIRVAQGSVADRLRSLERYDEVPEKLLQEFQALAEVNPAQAGVTLKAVLPRLAQDASVSLSLAVASWPAALRDQLPKMALAWVQAELEAAVGIYDQAGRSATERGRDELQEVLTVGGNFGGAPEEVHEFKRIRALQPENVLAALEQWGHPRHEILTELGVAKRATELIASTETTGNMSATIEELMQKVSISKSALESFLHG